MLIKKGEHSPEVLQRLADTGLFYGATTWRRRITFTESCRYHLNGVDMYDYNKVGGLSFGVNNHFNSARFGWRYCVSRDTIELCAYVYFKGKRMYRELADVRIGNTVTLEMKKVNDFFRFSMDFIEACAVPAPDSMSKCVFGQTIYFGGNQTAPHDIEILTIKV